VLLSLNENRYDVGETKGMGKDHPISWVSQVGPGRVFCTGMGHTAETSEEPLSLLHIVKGIEWARKFESE
jgi:type 1 glutamine amidotransferase